MPAEHEAQEFAKKYAEITARQTFRLISAILKTGKNLVVSGVKNHYRFKVGEVGLSRLAKSDLKIDMVDLSKLSESDLTQKIDIEKINETLKDDYIRFSWKDGNLYFYSRDRDRVNTALDNLLKKMTTKNGLKEFLKEEKSKVKAPSLDDKIMEAKSKVQKVEGAVKDRVMER